MGLDDTLMELSNRGIAGMGGSSAGDAWRNPPLEEHAPFDLTNPNFQQRFPPTLHHLPFTNQVSAVGVETWEVKRIRIDAHFTGAHILGILYFFGDVVVRAA